MSKDKKKPNKVSSYLLLLRRNALLGFIRCRSEGDDSIVDFYHCMQCGTSYEVYEPNEEEKQDYKEYWEKCQQNQNK